MELRGVYECLLREVEGVLGEVVGEVEEVKRFLKVLARMNRVLEEWGLGRIVVTGGFAVEVYTGRVYRTMDVDLVVDGLKAAELVEEVLKVIGERVGRGYLPKVSCLATKSIEIVSSVYTRRIEPVKLLVDSDWIYLDPPEELIVTYLAAWRYWGSSIDRDKALWLYVATKEILDESYLEARAREESVEKELEEIKELAKRAMGSTG